MPRVASVLELMFASRASKNAENARTAAYGLWRRSVAGDVAPVGGKEPCRVARAGEATRR